MRSPENKGGRMKLIEKAKMVKVELIDNWENNPRNIEKKDFERLKKQIQDLGIYKPLLCEKSGDRYITLGGNMRLKALKPAIATDL